ncbi:MAG: galactokinase [Bacteroidales bacterium]|nr:galactokinase [Candidatus Colimorpha merdihippi]
MKDKIIASFKERFGEELGNMYAAPGRINLIGEHTDYNGGFVFPGAVTQGIMAMVRPNGKRWIRLYAVDLESYCEFDMDDNDGPKTTHFRYVYGVVRELMERGVKAEGFDAVYAGDVPLGAGMSSSAALESCFATAVNDMFGGGLDRMALALAGQATEHKYVGVNCGIMDQFISMHGKAGSLVRLDCLTGEYAYFPWHPENYRLVLVNSCVKHELVGSPYNDRRNSCERVAKLLGVETLRDATWEMLEGVKNEISQEDYMRARYVLGEKDRVLAVCDALEKDDYETVGKQMYLTHDGLSKDYEVSCEEIDFLVDEARRLGVTGSRIMGGGFGGCTINLVRNDGYDAFVTEVQQTYRARFGVECKVIPVVIGDGARKL